MNTFILVYVLILSPSGTLKKESMPVAECVQSVENVKKAFANNPYAKLVAVSCVKQADAVQASK